MRAGDGGPAFPRIEHLENGDLGRKFVIGAPGMSLRDYLAGQALPGVVVAQQREGVASPELAAEDAYAIADAMLQRRDR